MHTSCSKASRLLVLTGIVALGLASQARADSLIFDGSLKNCTGPNCGAVNLNGISQKDAYGDSIPWTAEVFANPGECLRLEATSETADMKTVVVSPSGTAVTSSEPRITAQP